MSRRHGYPRPLFRVDRPRPVAPDRALKLDADQRSRVGDQYHPRRRLAACRIDDRGTSGSQTFGQLAGEDPEALVGHAAGMAGDDHHQPLDTRAGRRVPVHAGSAISSEQGRPAQGLGNMAAPVTSTPTIAVWRGATSTSIDSATTAVPVVPAGSRREDTDEGRGTDEARHRGCEGMPGCWSSGHPTPGRRACAAGRRRAWRPPPAHATAPPRCRPG
jgi:hypothetical protein